MEKFVNSLIGSIQREYGASMVEYALLAALIAVVVIGVIANFR